MAAHLSHGLGQLFGGSAGYFSRVVHFLVMRKVGEQQDSAGDVVQYLQAHPEVLDKMVDHVETTSIAEVGGMLACKNKDVFVPSQEFARH